MIAIWIYQMLRTSLYLNMKKHHVRIQRRRRKTVILAVIMAWVYLYGNTDLAEGIGLILLDKWLDQ